METLGELRSSAKKEVTVVIVIANHLVMFLNLF